jgi:hypothetical protein
MRAGYLQVFRNVIDSCATDIFRSSCQRPLLRGRSCLVIDREQAQYEFQSQHHLKYTIHLSAPPNRSHMQREIYKSSHVSVN